MGTTRTILFDLDGTLIDSTEAILESFAKAFEAMGDTPAKTEAICALIGHPLDVMFVELGVNPGRKWEYVEAYKAHYRVVSKAKTHLLPNAREALLLASKHARLGIVTTKTALYSRELLEHMGVMGYFETLVGREDVQNPKPHPEPVIKAVSKLQADTNGCWMVGDTPMDMEAAKAAGVTPVAVTCGYASKTELARHTPYLYRDALEAVHRIILQGDTHALSR